MTRQPILVVMGVCGSGKSRIGQLLAEALRLPFLEGDAFHPPENVARMSANIPLTDADRQGWLATLAGHIAAAEREGSGLVLSCSALKRSYRDQLRAASSRLRFVYLRGSRELIAERLSGRHGHFMPPSMLESQLRDLEEPLTEPGVLVCDIAPEPVQIVTGILHQLAL
ncbi:MAG TPA: gluconokinase [Candidatus Competibacteraceae bacterium]|nr:gluconokinase [Candidatus Competibacteraceae bacterium]